MQSVGRHLCCVGSEINDMYRVDACTGWLPDHKPRYVMGVGYPEDLVVCVALGADMFDCVWPTRTAVRSDSLYSLVRRGLVLSCSL